MAKQRLPGQLVILKDLCVVRFLIEQFSISLIEII
jgi:hypothetical protein